MSLGFLTESALVPSKGKSINVDSKSLLDLKSIVSRKENERKNRLKQEINHETNESTTKKSIFHQYKTGKKQSFLDKRKRKEDKLNQGIDKRNKKDQEQNEQDQINKNWEDDEEAWAKQASITLAKKAKLYEDMMNGKHKDNDCLVNFKEKRQHHHMNPSVIASKSYPSNRDIDDKQNDTKKVEIIDEFGRSIMVKRGSKEHLEYTKQKNHSIKSHPHDKSSNFSKLENLTATSSENTTFSTMEKQYIKDIHEETVIKRASAALSRKQKKQARLQMLQAQQTIDCTTKQEQINVDDLKMQQASEEAVAFLNQII